MARSDYLEFEERLHRCFNDEKTNWLDIFVTTKELTAEQKSFLVEFDQLARRVSWDEFFAELKSRNSTQLLFHFAYQDETDLERQHHQSSEQILSGMLRGRRVALVGPSVTAEETGHGIEIESYDLVARVNFQWPIPEERITDLGRRMDILYHCCNGDRPIRGLLENPQFLKTKFMCYERGLESLLLRSFCRDNNIPSLCVSESFRDLTDILRSAPNTGTVAIHHLLKFPIQELFVVGFSFFQDPYYKGYPGDGADPSHWVNQKSPTEIWEHQFGPQLEYFRRLTLSDRRIRVDKRLQEILRLTGFSHNGSGSD